MTNGGNYAIAPTVVFPVVIANVTVVLVVMAIPTAATAALATFTAVTASAFTVSVASVSSRGIDFVLPDAVIQFGRSNDCETAVIQFGSGFHNHSIISIFALALDVIIFTIITFIIREVVIVEVDDIIVIVDNIEVVFFLLFKITNGSCGNLMV